MSGKANAGDKEADELRNQLQRLERLIHAIQTAPEPLRRRIAAAARNFAPKKQPEIVDIETADLVGALTRLCFATATYQHDVPLPNGQSEIVADAKAHLAATEAAAPMPPAPRPTVTARTVPDLVALLPPWEVAHPLLTSYAQRWWGCNDLLFPPAWFNKVAGMYQSGFSPLPHPHFLAELFGVMALSLRGQASDRGAMSPEHAEADRYAAYCQRSLDVGAYLDKPSLEGIRSLSLLVSYHAFWGVSLARGLTILPVALSLVMQLDFHRPDGDFVGAETSLESFERRALVSVLVRSDWSYPHTLGRASIADPKVFLATPPQYLGDDKYPVEAARSPFRPIKPVVQALNARHHLARLHQRMTTELYQTNKMKIASAAIVRYSRDIETIEGTHLCDELRWEESNGLQAWVVPNVDQRTHIARIHTNADFALFRVRLHKPFVGGTAAMAQIPANFDENHHWDELIRWSRIYLWLWEQAEQCMGGTFASTFAFAFDPIIVLALLVLLQPQLPDRDALKVAARWFPKQADRPEAAPAVRRLGRLIGFLLDRAETVMEPPLEPPRKRSKTTHQNNGFANGKAPQGNRRSSAPAVVPVPSMPLPTMSGTNGILPVPEMPMLGGSSSFFTPADALPVTSTWSSFNTPQMEFSVDPLASLANGDALSNVNSQATHMLGDLGVDLNQNPDPLAFLRGMDQAWSASAPSGSIPIPSPGLTTPGDLGLDDALLKALAGGS